MCRRVQCDRCKRPTYAGCGAHRDSRDSISSELVGRDGFGNNDFVGIIFDTYRDKINAFEYFVTPLNEQMDAKFTESNNNGEDFSWNSIFYSKTAITETGWNFEMFIPFASIRFSKTDTQDWGINFVRRRSKSTAQYFWHPLDPNVNGFLTQAGVWKGLKHINPSLRLQLSPYVSYYANHFPQQNAKDLNSQFKRYGYKTGSQSSIYIRCHLNTRLWSSAERSTNPQFDTF